MTTDTKDIGPQIRMQLDQMVDHLNNMPIGASLVWLWSWDLIRDKYNTYKDIHDYDDYVITEGTTLDTIWDKLWSSPPSEFTLEYGAEFIDEAIIDWMIDNEFLAILEDDGWLEDSDDNEDVDNQSN
jgi:hypothetical protein